MQKLWAPWRMEYIKKAGKIACFLCATGRQRQDEKNLILLRGRVCFCILNKFPYNVGHLMVAPLAHKGDLSALSREEIVEMWKLAVDMQKVLRRAIKPAGYNIGINVGRIAGAGLPDHLHLHIVPRWSGDTNYMPVTGGTKVLPMALAELYKLLSRRL